MTLGILGFFYHQYFSCLKGSSAGIKLSVKSYTIYKIYIIINYEELKCTIITI